MAAGHSPPPECIKSDSRRWPNCSTGSPPRWWPVRQLLTDPSIKRAAGVLRGRSPPWIRRKGVAAPGAAEPHPSFAPLTQPSQSGHNRGDLDHWDWADSWLLPAADSLVATGSARRPLSGITAPGLPDKRVGGVPDHRFDRVKGAASRRPPGQRCPGQPHVDPPGVQSSQAAAGPMRSAHGAPREFSSLLRGQLGRLRRRRSTLRHPTWR